MGFGFGDPYMMWNNYFIWNSWYNPYFYNPYYGGGYVVVGGSATSVYNNLRPFNTTNVQEWPGPLRRNVRSRNTVYRPGMTNTTAYNSNVSSRNPNSFRPARTIITMASAAIMPRPAVTPHHSAAAAAVSEAARRRQALIPNLIKARGRSMTGLLYFPSAQAPSIVAQAQYSSPEKCSPSAAISEGSAPAFRLSARHIDIVYPVLLRQFMVDAVE